MSETGLLESSAELDSFPERVKEHGRLRAVLESFAYVRPFGGMFGKIVPLYAESYWYAMGGLAFLMFVFLTASGVILALLGPFWWLTNSFGKAVKAFHYWSAQAFFFFALLHLFRVWATGSFRGRRIFNWWIGLMIFMLAMGENLFGLLARGDWESQFVSMHSDDMLFVQPFFFHLFSPANFTADLAIHIAVMPVIIAGLILAHIVLVRINGMNRPLPLAQTNSAMTQAARDGMPSERMVRHVFWKYPVIAAVALVALVGIAVGAGSPNSPRETIAAAARADPGVCVLAFTHELAGAGSSSQNAREYGVGDPAQVFVLNPLRAALPLLGQLRVAQLPTLQADDVAAAVATYDSASPAQRKDWATEYHQAVDSLVPMSASAAMGAATSPDYMKIGGLRGDFGPIPILVEADLFLASNGYLETYLQDVDPGHSFHLVNIWLYDHPELLNTAVNLGLTDDQWGMVKERGFGVGPWYLFLPAVIHIYFPGGSTGTGFVLWNIGFALILLFAVPLLPGVRNLPDRLKLYRFIYRYPRPGELDQPALRERHGPVHSTPEGGGQ